MTQLKTIKGADALGKALLAFPVELRDKAMKGALRAGAAPIRADAKANAPALTGDMAKGISVRLVNKRDVLTATVFTGGKHGYLANWAEHGTAAHALVPKKGRKVLAFDGASGAFGVIGALFFAKVWNPGAKPHPFMRPALDRRANEALSTVGKYLGRWIAKQNGERLARGASPVSVEDVAE